MVGGATHVRQGGSEEGEGRSEEEEVKREGTPQNTRRNKGRGKEEIARMGRGRREGKRVGGRGMGGGGGEREGRRGA
jgi:hypothetical protein